MLLVVLSTLAMVGLLIDPSLFGINKPAEVKSSKVVRLSPRADSLRKDSIRKSNIEQNIYIYDKLNYSLSTLSLKRDKLLLLDSIYRIWKIADNYKSKVDSISKVFNSGTKSADSLRKAITKINQKEGKGKQTAKTQTEYSGEQISGYAKVYESMDPVKAAKQIELMSEDDALELLINMQSRPAAKILDKIEPIKAAKIWLILNSKKKR